MSPSPPSPPSSSRLEADAPDGIGEVTAGTDLVALVATALPDLADGDVVVVTSKVVSKAEGRGVTGTRDDVLPGETVRPVARRGPTRIVVNHLGLTMAAAGIDASNVDPGTVLLLPLDPDRTAADLRAGLWVQTGANVGVVVGDTAGRAWRHGQTDLAIGAAGLIVLDDHAGRTDPYGNPLAVTAPAVADEVAGLAELVSGKLGGRPVVRVRGLAHHVLPAGDDGAGARSLVREIDQDMFALGAREAVLAALAGAEAAAFGTPVPVEELVSTLADLGFTVGTDPVTDPVTSPVTVAADDVAAARLLPAAFALGWRARHTPGSGVVRLHPRTP